MNRLFNNVAYPLASAPEQIAALLASDTTRAVFYRPDNMAATIAELQSSITSTDKPWFARKYVSFELDGTRTQSAGRTAYFDPVTMDQVEAEAKEAGIIIASDLNSLALLTRRINKMRDVFTQAYREYSGDTESPIVTHLLFTPKGGVGRSPMLHVDNLPLTGHWSAALSGMDIMVTEPAEHLWGWLDKRETSQLSADDQRGLMHILIKYAIDNQADFDPAEIGDLLIFKGQKLRDLSKAEDRAQVCVHKSAAQIVESGQAAAMFYPKLNKL